MRELEKREDESLGFQDASREKFQMGYIRQFEYWDWCADISRKPKTDPKRIEIRKNVLVMRRKFLG
jgi:hypothetical protein